MDIILRGKVNGIHTAEQIRSRFNIPVVYLTAYADKQTLQRAKITEPYGYIIKPFEERELYSVIEMAIYKHRMEKKLRDSRQWLATTLNSIGDAVIATDSRGLVTFMNPVAETLTAWTMKKATGRPITEIFHIVHEETYLRCENPVEKVMEIGQTVRLTDGTVLVARDGKERLVAHSAAPIFNSGNEIMGVVMVFQDVTIRRRMEEELMKIQKLESLGVLAGGIAHDFNNILTAILGNISLAKMYKKAEDKNKKLADVEKATLRAQLLTQQMLTFARGGAPLLRTASIRELLGDTASFALRGSNVRCDCDIPNDLWLVKMDHGQMSQVINNLIINADQAMPNGGIVRIHAENIQLRKKHGIPLLPGPYIKLSVVDEGVGIPKKNFSQIFDPYFTTKQKGSGLGLTTTYSIIKHHKGHITVDSRLGAGTTFHIYLPAFPDKVLARRKVDENQIIRGSGRILVMDDEEMVRKSLRDMLRSIGYTVTVARDGSEVIDLFQKAGKSKRPFHAVIVDLTVRGGMGGKVALKKLKALDSSVKVIVSSGYSNDSVMANFRKYGFRGVLSKPYRALELSLVLHQVLKGKRKS